MRGLQVPLLWPEILKNKSKIEFAHRPFKWKNLAANNAGVTVNIVGVSNDNPSRICKIFEGDQVRTVSNINAYLVAAQDIFVKSQPHPASGLPAMVTGCMPRDGGNLLLSMEESEKLIEEDKRIKGYIRRYIGTDELIKGKQRYCLWISDVKPLMPSQYQH